MCGSRFSSILESHSMRRYANEPNDRRAYTARFNRRYTRFAKTYDRLVKTTSVWRRWLRHALPRLVGPRVLEVSCGTGWLMTQYADRFDVYGVDLNGRMLATAQENLDASGVSARLQLGDVELLPFADASFDTVLCTMAFSGYPNAHAALTEMIRVLKADGVLVLIDISYPSNGNFLGSALTRLWIWTGDLVRDMGALFEEHRLLYSDAEIGGWGSVHLYVASQLTR
jgi:ubiquinone/menaquinone biosynthesis C-methylase UbiE